MSLVKKLAGETAIYGLSHIFSRVLFFLVFTVYLTRKLPEAEYGIYADMYSYSALLLVLLSFRMDTAFFRFGSQSKDSRTVFSNALFPVIVVSILLLIIMIMSSPYIGGLMGYSNAAHYVRWFAYILVFDALGSMVYAKLRLESRPFRFLVYRLINVVLIVVFVLLFLEYLPRYHPDVLKDIGERIGVVRSIDYVFYSNLIASLVTFLLMIPEIKLSRRMDFSMIGKMLKYSWPLVLVAIAGSINQAFAAPIQKYFLGADVLDNLPQVGVYAAAAKLAILLNLFTTAFNYAAEPFFFNNASHKDSRQVYGKVALAFTIFACLVTLGIVFNLDILIHLIGYQEGRAVVPILLMAYVFLGIYYNIGIWYKLSDKTIYGAFISFIGAIITLLVSILLLPKIGTIASAIAALTCYVVMVLLGYMLGQKHYPIDYPVGKMVKYILITVLLIALAEIMRSYISSTFIYIAVFAVVFGLLVFYVYKKDYKEIISM